MVFSENRFGYANSIDLDEISLLWITCLSLLCCFVSSLQPCGRLLGGGWPLGSRVCLCVFVTFPYGVPGRSLIVSIPACSMPSSLLHFFFKVRI